MQMLIILFVVIQGFRLLKLLNPELFVGVEMVMSSKGLLHEFFA